MLISIAWKNIWRNRSRSIIIMLAITLGIYGGLFILAFMQGMVKQRLSTALNTEISYIQIHHPEYLENDDFNCYINNVNMVEGLLQDDSLITAYSKRIIVNSMASSAETGTGVKVTGVDPETEITVTNLHEKVVDGAYFEGVKRNPAVVGQKLAEKMNLKVRSKIVIQFQDANGELTAGAFRVAGIYKTTNTAFDEFNVFVDIDDLRRLTSLGEGRVHEIALRLNKIENVPEVRTNLGDRLEDMEVLTWKERDMMLGWMSESMNQYMYVIMFIILLALFFGIINTMLMAILERVKELGMLMAVGMNKLRIFLMIMLETVLLSLTGAVLGIIVGLITIAYFEKAGLDLSLWAEGYEAYGFDAVIYTTIDTNSVIMIVILVLITGLIASIFPSRKALKLKPVEALRTDN